MGCGASTTTGATPGAPSDSEDFVEVTNKPAKKVGKPRTRRASVNVNIEDEEDEIPTGGPSPASSSPAGPSSASPSTNVSSSSSKAKKPRGRRQSVEAVELTQEEKDADAFDGRLQNSSSSKAKKKSGGGAKSKGARQTRRGSINNELDAMAMMAAVSAAESGGGKEKKSRSKDYLNPNPKYAADFKRTKIKDLKEVATLGVGTFSRVKLVKHRGTGKTYALKIMRQKKIEQMKQTTHIMNEKRILLEMDHPFIIQLMATGSNKACLFMVTELVQGGELFSVLTREEVLDEAQTRFYAGCIVLAIEALHEKDNVYRDLKPENILLDNEGYAKLCDFGFAKKIEGERTHTTCGTPEYVSPEMLQPDGHGKATDYWCIGIFVYECLCATTPFAADNYMDTYEQIQKYAVAGPAALPWQPGVALSAGAKALIAGLLNPDVGKRLGCRSGGPREIREHVWFKGFDWDDLYHKRMPTEATPGAAGYVPFVPTVKGDEDYSNFETDEYGDDSDAEEYRGDGSWFAAF